ncbi:SGNH hydrolase-type esterase domain-containing protein [Diaporthe sp. PMI_573]|nr:SGNH hydrolase-type esterase domain-containing protein [Diaporthaceae sp. PMI_573]
MAAPLTNGLALPEAATDSDPFSAAIASSADTNTVRILVCGDSISQGREGDFTWRYRLWEWFHNNSKTHADTANNNKNTYPTIQYVGPFNGTLPASVDAIDVDPTNPQTWGTYHPTVSPLFSPGGGSSHFAVYGRPAWQDIEPLHGQVTTHRPDVLVLHLGFNDIGWWGNNATDLIFSVQRLVFNARLARPDIKILIADVSHRLGVSGREDIEGITNQYNDLLDASAAQWWTEGSPVEVVKVSKVYDCQVTACPAGIDGLHPNSLGEFQIARAYTQVLHDKFHYGAAPLEVPSPDTIPGFLASSSSSVGGPAAHPPVTFLAAAAGLFSFVLIAALRPEWLRLRRGRFGLGGVMKGRYHLLPSR